MKRPPVCGTLKSVFSTVSESLLAAWCSWVQVLAFIIKFRTKQQISQPENRNPQSLKKLAITRRISQDLNRVEVIEMGEIVLTRWNTALIETLKKNPAVFSCWPDRLAGGESIYNPLAKENIAQHQEQVTAFDLNHRGCVRKHVYELFLELSHENCWVGSVYFEISCWIQNVW